MDLRLTQEQRLVQDMVRKFAANELEPKAEEADHSQTYPKENIKKMAELGLLGMLLPTEYEAGDMDSVSVCIVLEEVSRVCASTGSILIAHNGLATYPILQYGSQEQKNTYLPRLARGDFLGAFALTESEAGSDIDNIKSEASARGDYYILNGKKTFVMNGENADLFLVFARENGGLRCFIMERAVAGLRLVRMPYLLGVRASGMSELFMEGCSVPRSSLIEADARTVAGNALQLARLLVAAQAVGIAQASLDSSVKYAKERRQFGRALCEFQLIQEMLAQMATRICAARELVYRAAVERDAASDFSVQAAMAKWFASETASFAGRAAVQVHGGYGYTKDFPVERYLRDAKVTEIYCETSELQKLSITERLLK
ncbi:hypothetical protein AMJ40_01840 [candidate division TA06 bacterium DG_26]|uniref:Acyl-CoA dehydrogenase n=1 Tax=candidate division TA06 bacterium DG_26 TaxID=1703771 RepID=A0A0S7WKX1_UNCT6|nr:MAG: hypothetical protein AMJ40_01840 [candidate division TA06 bacterium DG_26]